MPHAKLILLTLTLQYFRQNYLRNRHLRVSTHIHMPFLYTKTVDNKILGVSSTIFQAASKYYNISLDFKPTIVNKFNQFPNRTWDGVLAYPSSIESWTFSSFLLSASIEIRMIFLMELLQWRRNTFS